MTLENRGRESILGGLTPLQERFVRAYARTGNATKAAILAGYSGRCARQVGSSTLKKPHVKQALESLRCAERTPKAEMTPEWALYQLLEETSDPNPRVRLDAKKAVAQAVGVFSQKQQEVSCPRCTARTELNGLPEEELELRLAGTSRERVLTMSKRDFTQWAQSVRDQAENWIRLADNIRELAGVNGK